MCYLIFEIKSSDQEQVHWTEDSPNLRCDSLQRPCYQVYEKCIFFIVSFTDKCIKHRNKFSSKAEDKEQI